MKMTNAITTFTLLATLCFSSLVKSDDVVVPVIAKPAVLQEGTQRELTADQIAELLPWAKNSKVFLDDLLNSLQGLSSADKLDRLEDGIKSVVSESAPKNSELLMRYVLNRGMVINDLLKAEMSSDEVGSSDTKLRVLISSVKMAITYYDIDMNTLTKKADAPFIAFGSNYFKFLTELNKSIFDASASYLIQRTALEWLQWDLYRDLNNHQMAPQIVKINNTLKLLPVKKMSDAQYISAIRQMKLIAGLLDLNGTRVQVEQEEESSFNVRKYSSNYIAECTKTMSSGSYQSSCISLAKKNKLSPGLILLCGKLTSSDSYIYSCMDKMPENYTEETINSYMTCSKVMSSQDYVLSCIDLVNKYHPQTGDIQECGNSTSTNDYAYSCIELAGKYKSRNNFSEVMITCASIMSAQDYTYSCLELALKSATNVRNMNACKVFGPNAYKYSCIEKLKIASLNDEKIEVLHSCIEIMGDQDYKLNCVDALLTKSNMTTYDIEACGQMKGNSSKYQCLQNL